MVSFDTPSDFMLFLITRYPSETLKRYLSTMHSIDYDYNLRMLSARNFTALAEMHGSVNFSPDDAYQYLYITSKQEDNND